MTLQELQKRLRIAKNRKKLGLNYKVDLIRIVRDDPDFVLNTLTDIVEYYIDQINELSKE